MKNPHPKKSHEYWMELARQEAKKGVGKTSPNPAVGAVVVRQGKLLGKGYHRRAGLPHAEIEALKKVTNPQGARMYVTLEPCCHKDKRTPPCVDAIIGSGIEEVIVGTRDPNPKVAGKGIRRLQQAGMRTRAGILEEECRELNRYYNHWIRRRQPWTIIKVAASLDGRIALANGESLWITNPISRREAHRVRSEVDAILIGIGTVLSDNPRLSARVGRRGKQPIRVVLDPRLRVPPDSRILSSQEGGATWILTAAGKTNSAKANRLRKGGIEILGLPLGPSGTFPIKKIKKILGERGIGSLLVEGGPGVWTSFIREDDFDELHYFIAPKFLGGDALPVLEALKLKHLPGSGGLRLHEWIALRDDVLLRYRRK